MKQPEISSAIRRITAGLAVASALLVGVASAGAAPAEAASPVAQSDGSRSGVAGEQPRIVDVKGFAYRPKAGKALRVAALVLSRYPEVDAREFAKRYRKHLHFRAHAKLDVFDGDKRIARGREAESLPVLAKKHSLRFVHLLTFSRAESEAILAADDPRATPARALGSDAEETVETTALSALKVSARGKTLERSHTEEDALVGLADQAPPRVVDGCVIAPRSRCIAANLSFADLSGADLHHANIFHSHFYGTNLSRADLSDAIIYLANFTSANLSGANLSYADLHWANLSSANLSGADLTHADLSGADLSRANLSDADLHHANLSRVANLSGAKFCNTTWTDGSVNNSGC